MDNMTADGQHDGLTCLSNCHFMALFCLIWRTFSLIPPAWPIPSRSGPVHSRSGLVSPSPGLGCSQPFPARSGHSQSGPGSGVSPPPLFHLEPGVGDPQLPLPELGPLERDLSWRNGNRDGGAGTGPGWGVGGRELGDGDWLARGWRMRCLEPVWTWKSSLFCICQNVYDWCISYWV